MRNINLHLGILYLFVGLISKCSASDLFSGQANGLEQSYLSYLNLHVCQNIQWNLHDQDYNVANRNYLSEKAITQFNKKIFEKRFDFSDFQEIWSIVLWLIFNILMVILLLKCFCKVTVRTKIAQEEILLSQEKQRKVKISHVMLLFVSYAIIIVISMKGLSLVPQLKSNALSQLCSYVAPYSQKNIYDYEIYRSKNEVQRSIFLQNDDFYYQLELLSLYQKAAQILKMQRFKIFKQDLTQANKILPNISFLQKLQIKAANLTNVLEQISSDANIFKQFVNYVRVTIKNNKKQLTTSFRKLDYYLSRIQFLPSCLIIWFTTIFTSLIIGYCILFKQIYALYRNKRINKKSFKNVNSFLRFITFTTLITFVLMLISQNTIFFKCMRNKDFRNLSTFQQYFLNYESNQDPYYQEFMRKKFNHSVSNLFEMNSINIKERSSNAIRCFQETQQLFKSKEMVQIDEQIKKKQLEINNSQTQFIEIRQQLEVIIGYLKICKISLNNVKNFKFQQISSNKISNIGKYENISQSHLCETNLDFVMRINTIFFFIIICYLSGLLIFLKAFKEDISIIQKNQELISMEIVRNKEKITVNEKDSTENKLYQALKSSNQRYINDNL